MLGHFGFGSSPKSCPSLRSGSKSSDKAWLTVQSIPSFETDGDEDEGNEEDESDDSEDEDEDEDEDVSAF